MTNATATRIAAAAGFLAVALGAFGAHGLKNPAHAKRHDDDLGKSRVIPFHSRRNVVRAGGTKTFSRRRVVEFSDGNRAFFRFALFAGGDERALAGCDHTIRRTGIFIWLGVVYLQKTALI
jgi:hypothetical protein